MILRWPSILLLLLVLIIPLASSHARLLRGTVDFGFVAAVAAAVVAVVVRKQEDNLEVAKS